MKETITVVMEPEYLFDFQLYHTYSKFSGFLSNVLGAAVAFIGIILFATGKIALYQVLFYLIASVLFISYTPLLLKRRSKVQVKEMEKYRNPATFTFGEEGITVLSGEKVEHYEWNRFIRVVTTPKTIGFYYEENEALIIPKADFKDRFVPIMTMVTKNMKPGNVRFH